MNSYCTVGKTLLLSVRQKIQGGLMKEQHLTRHVISNLMNLAEALPSFSAHIRRVNNDLEINCNGKLLTTGFKMNKSIKEVKQMWPLFHLS